MNECCYMLDVVYPHSVPVVDASVADIGIRTLLVITITWQLV